MTQRGKGTPSSVRVRRIDVVIVDADARACAKTSAYLREHGCVVRTAATVDDALALVKESVPDAVVTELDLGQGLTGWALAKLLRHEPRTSRVLRVAVTAFGEDEDLRMFFDAHLKKPVGLDALLDVLHEVTKIPRTRGPRTVLRGL